MSLMSGLTTFPFLDRKWSLAHPVCPETLLYLSWKLEATKLQYAGKNAQKNPAVFGSSLLIPAMLAASTLDGVKRHVCVSRFLDQSPRFSPLKIDDRDSGCCHFLWGCERVPLGQTTHADRLS